MIAPRFARTQCPVPRIIPNKHSQVVQNDALISHRAYSQTSVRPLQFESPVNRRNYVPAPAPHLRTLSRPRRPSPQNLVIPTRDEIEAWLKDTCNFPKVIVQFTDSKPLQASQFSCCTIFYRLLFLASRWGNDP